MVSILCYCWMDAETLLSIVCLSTTDHKSVSNDLTLKSKSYLLPLFSTPIKSYDKITRHSTFSDQKTKRWYGKAIVPLTYFPPQVDRMNAYAIHDQQNEPIYKSLYPSNGAQPDFHDLESFASLDNTLPSLNDMQELSSIWTEALSESSKSDDN